MTDTESRGMNAGRIPLKHQVKAALGIGGVTARGVLSPPAERAIGCDVSKWDGLVNYQTMSNAGARFCYFKATQGNTIFDSQYNNSRTNCTQLPWGSYHFLSASVAGATQADWFCDHMGDNGGLLPPVVDVELSSVASSIVKQFILQVYARLNVYCIVYTSAYYWSLVTGSDKAWISDHCGLWVAHYGTDYPLLPTGWTDYIMHQYSADGNMLGPTYGGQGSSMDLNRARISWVNQYDPQPTIEERVTAIEDWIVRHG